MRLLICLLFASSFCFSQTKKIMASARGNMGVEDSFRDHAVHNNRLHILGRTNLGLYNKGGQALETVKDSLQFPLIVQIPL